jgi:6-phosphogluconolactonase
MGTAIAKPQLRIAATAQEAADQSAGFILDDLAQVLGKSPRAAIAISGGSTPKLLFASLAKRTFDWSNVHFFWVDERCVPPSDSQSNFKLANDFLLAPAKIPAANIHRVFGELPPEEGASRYVAEIKLFFSLSEGQIPVFDILHRGMGPDAHTASLFPGEPLIADRQHIAADVWVEKMKMDRVTLLPAVLLAAKRTVLQVSGSDKADALRNVLNEPEDLFQYPCQIGSRDERAIWFIDQAAAANL